MTVPVRKLAFTYGGITIGVGGAAGYVITGVHQIREAYDEFEFECTVVLRGATSASAQALDMALRAALTKPDQSDFDITIDGTSWLALSHSGHTWLSPRTELRSLERFRTLRSRGYLVRITAGMPADLSGRAGRRDSQWRVTTQPTGQKLLDIEATYTALSGTGTAYAVAVADFLGTYVAAIQAVADNTATWVETPAVEYQPDDQNKVCVARARYQERLIDDSGSSVEEANFRVRGYAIAVQRPEARVLAHSGARPLIRATVSFGADVETSASIQTVYTGKILPYLATLVTSHTDVAGSPRVAAEAVEFDPWRNVLQGSVTYLVTQTSLLAASKRIRGRESSGATLVPKLDRKKPFRKVRFDGPQYRMRTIEVLTLELIGGNRHKGIVDAARKEAEAAGYVWLDTQTVEEETEVPTIRTNPLKLVERGSIITFEYGEFDKSKGIGKISGKPRLITGTGL